MSAPWDPDFPAVLLILGTIIALFLPELYELVWNRRFWSPERKRIEDVTRFWRERASHDL